MSSRQPHEERTFVILKPDTVQRSLIGEVIKRFEHTGLKCTAMKMFMADEERLFKHYNKNDEWFLKKGSGIVEDLKNQGLPVEKDAMEYGKDIIRANAVYMSAAPVIAMIWEGNQAIAVIKKITGTTEPSTSDVGTLRGDYTVDSYAHSSYENRAVRNLIHCSDEPSEAEREIALWFSEDEIQNYVTAQERIMYDVNFDGTKD
ncbi:MAG: nucleoside-diphosphate kinase [Candidatus Paceibacterota bacterium]